MPECFSAFCAGASDVHFLFVNDGSTDSTGHILEQLHQSNPNAFSWLNLERNGGKAAAVRAGVLMAMGDPKTRFVGYWDADLATPLESIPHFMKRFETTPPVDMVFGARVRLLGRDIQRRPVRHYLGRCFATVASLVLRLPIYDTQCGAKIFRVTPELREVFTAPFLTSWVFDVEILARFMAQRHGNSQSMSHAIFEYPLHQWKDVAGSRVKPLDFVKAFWELLRIYWVYLR